MKSDVTEYTEHELKLDISRRYQWFDSMFGPDAMKNIVDLKVPMETAVALSRFHSILPDQDWALFKSLRYCMKEFMPVSFMNNSGEVIKIIGPIKKYYYFPVAIRGPDLPFVSTLRPDRKLEYENKYVCAKFFVDDKDFELIETIKSTGHKLHSLYAFNCLRLSDRESGDVRMWISEVPEVVGQAILEWQDVTCVPLTLSNSPSIDYQYYMEWNGEMRCELRFGPNPSPLTWKEEQLIRRSSLPLQKQMDYPVSKRGYMNIDKRYGRSEFRRSRKHYLKAMEEGYSVEKTREIISRHIKELRRD